MSGHHRENLHGTAIPFQDLLRWPLRPFCFWRCKDPVHLAFAMFSHLFNKKADLKPTQRVSNGSSPSHFFASKALASVQRGQKAMALDPFFKPWVKGNDLSRDDEEIPFLSTLVNYLRYQLVFELKLQRFEGFVINHRLWLGKCQMSLNLENSTCWQSLKKEGMVKPLSNQRPSHKIHLIKMNLAKKHETCSYPTKKQHKETTRTSNTNCKEVNTLRATD